MDITWIDRFVKCCNVTETAINFWQAITGLDLVVRKVRTIKISIIPQQFYPSSLKTSQEISRYFPIMSHPYQEFGKFYKILKKSTNIFRN